MPLIVLADNSVNQPKIDVIVKPNNTIVIRPQNYTIIVQPQNNTEIEKLVQKLIERPPWTQGDIIISSGTIFAFFAFGSFLVLRFESTKVDVQLKWMIVLLLFIGGVQALHLSVIISIMLQFFNPTSYAGVIGTTIGFLSVILFSVYKIAWYENKFKDRKSDVYEKMKAYKKGVEEGQRSINEKIERELDNLRRERLKFQHESGE